MAAKKKRHGPGPTGHRSLHPITATLRTELAAAEALLAREQWQEARAALEPLAKRYPGHIEILGPLLEAAQALQDWRLCQWAYEQLEKLLPDDPELVLSQAAVYVTHGRMALAAQAYRRFLQRWPEHEEAAEARVAADALEESLRHFLGALGVSGDDVLSLAVLHDEVQSLLEQGDYPGTRRAARKFLARLPHFAPVLNNVSLSFYAQGQLDEAIKTAQQVLEFDSGNIHALSNLTRFSCLSGREEDAHKYAAQLKASTEPATDRSCKIAEALSYLGDDAGVLEAFARVQSANEWEGAASEALIYHLAAVAALRLDRVTEARRHWEQALQVAPGLELAQENLADLKLPAEDRHGPWPFVLHNWISGDAVRTLATQVEAVMLSDHEASVAPTIRSWARRNPRVVGLIPLLLERGDPGGRQFALQIATALGTPEMAAALRDFALGRWGPDKMRLDAAQAAQAAELLPSGAVRLWIKGEWTELRLMNYEFHNEPLFSHPPQVHEWLQEAVTLVHGGRLGEAERLLNQAREAEPDAPDILNNLAGVYSQQGRSAESEALIRQSYALDPNYLFARTNLALILARQGDVAQAKELIDPLLSRRRLHFSELASLALAQIEVFIIEEMPETAKVWLDMWEGVDPEHPLLPIARQRIKDAQGSPLDVVRRAWRKA